MQRVQNDGRRADCERPAMRPTGEMGGFFMDKLIRGYKPNEFNTPDIFKYKTNLTANARLVYLFLIRHYAIEGDTAPSKNEIAYYLESSKRTVDNAMKELIEVGLVQVIHRKKTPTQNDNNMYIFYHPEQVGFELKTPYEELKYKKQKATKKVRQKSSAKNALLVVQNLHHQENSGAKIALPPQESSIDAGSCDLVVQKLHGTSLLDLDRKIDSEYIPNDHDLSDEEAIKLAFKKYFKVEITDKQAESFVDIAVEQGLTLEEVLAEMEYISKYVKIKTTSAATLYSSLSAGGWAKKKREEATKKQQKPKRRLARKVSLPQSIQKQLEEEEKQKQGEQTVNETKEREHEKDESWKQKEAELREKIRLMNERFKGTKTPPHIDVGV